MERGPAFDGTTTVISHFNKAGNSNALYKVTDSVAFTAAARSVWLTASDESGQKMMLKGKNNIGPDPGGLSYSIDVVDIGKGIKAPRIVWGEPVTVTADEVLNARKERGSSAMDEAMLWLESYLSDGARPQKEVMEAAQRVGHSTITLKRAKRGLSVESFKGDFGDGWQWRLPEHEEDH